LRKEADAKRCRSWVSFVENWVATTVAFPRIQALLCNHSLYFAVADAMVSYLYTRQLKSELFFSISISVFRDRGKPVFCPYLRYYNKQEKQNGLLKI